MKFRVLTGILVGLIAYLAAVIAGLAYRLPLSSVLIKGIKSMAAFAIIGILTAYIIEKAAEIGKKDKDLPAQTEKSINQKIGVDGQDGTGRGQSERDKEKEGQRAGQRRGKTDPEERAGKGSGGAGTSDSDSDNFKPLDLPVLEVEGE